jgi:hypothetical protein
VVFHLVASAFVASVALPVNASLCSVDLYVISVFFEDVLVKRLLKS